MNELTPPIASHVAIENLFRDVLAAIESGEAERVVPLWKEFERTISAHLEYEERNMLVDLLVARPREGRVILEEHRHLRARLAELRDALPNIPIASARTFLNEFRAHESHEERVLYRWAGPSPSPSPPKPVP
jgi:hypothetical protein